MRQEEYRKIALSVIRKDLSGKRCKGPAQDKGHYAVPQVYEAVCIFAEPLRNVNKIPIVYILPRSV